MSVLNVKYVLLGSLALFLSGCDTKVMVPTPVDGNGGGGSSAGAARMTSLQVTPAENRIPVGLQQQLFTKAVLDDGSTTDVVDNALVQWSSSDESVATVDGTGRATGIGAGNATIKAMGTVNGVVFEASAQLVVIDAVVTDLAINPTTAPSLPPTASQPIVTTAFVANATLSDDSSLELTNNPALNWSSSDEAVATVNNKGIATAVGVGTTTITVSGMLNGQNFTATADLTVAP